MGLTSIFAMRPAETDGDCDWPSTSQAVNLLMEIVGIAVGIAFECGQQKAGGEVHDCTADW